MRLNLESVYRVVAVLDTSELSYDRAEIVWHELSRGISRLFFRSKMSSLLSWKRLTEWLFCISMGNRNSIQLFDSNHQCGSATVWFNIVR